MRAASSDKSWVNLWPSRHFVKAEDRARRCGTCKKRIRAGEKYYATWKIDYSGVIRFHVECAEEYAEVVFL
jgi:hypothetical protein